MTHNGEKFPLAQKMLADIQARARQADAFDAHLDYLDGIIADLKALDANIPGSRTAAKPPSRGKPLGSDGRLAEWRCADRKAWAEYRKWEDQHFPIDPTKPFKDPPGMVAARRAFEREQEISKAREILRLREASRVRR
jgi:hypothetical protein